MNSENFHEYVKNPSMLHQVSYQELKSLVLQYPYSPNLRYLLLLKSLLDQHKDFDKNQILASLSSPDRKKLRQLVKQYTKIREQQENYTLNEDFLELKDLSVLEDLVAEPSVTATAPPKEATIVPPPVPPKFELMDEEESDLGFLEGLIGGETGGPDEAKEPAPGAALEELPTEPVDVEQLPLGTEMTLEDIMEQEHSPAVATPSELSVQEETLPDLDEAPSAPATAEAPSTAATKIPLEITNEADLQPTPLPKSSFNAWLRKLNPPQAGILNADLKDISLNSKHLHTQEVEKEPAPNHFADHSVEEDEEIASETLALLLEKQKFFGKAISMYQRLQLLNPEKSSLFAAKIEELNKKL
jgi:hypothetical protein